MIYPFSRRAGHAVTAAALVLMLAGHTAFAQAPVMRPSGSSLATAASEDIRDIRGPKAIASVWLVPLIAIAGLLIAGSGYVTWRWIGRRRRMPDKSTADIALERLEKARLLMQPERGREFSIEVSGIVRDYIEARFEVMAAHLTTDEFLSEILESSQSLLASHRDLLGEFLKYCDLAKFGGWNLREENMDEMLQAARRFVTESIRPELAKSPQPEPPTGASRDIYVSVPTT